VLDQAGRAAKRRDIYSEITLQLIAAIEADPGKPALHWRRSSGGPLFMPVNALTNNANNGVSVVPRRKRRNAGFSN
jgi:antirestriction protein ArdC